MQVFKNRHIHKKNHVIIVIPAYNGVEEQVLVDKVDFPKIELYFWRNLGTNHIVTSQVQTPDSSKLVLDLQ